MNKKIFVFPLVALLLALSLSAHAQQLKKIPRVGLLAITPPSSLEPRIKSFREALQRLGYVEGQSISIEYRHGEGKRDRVPDVVAELVREKG